MLNFVRQGAGPPLVLVHGLGGSRRSWDTVVPALSEAREVIALDLPGHGGSPVTDGSDTFVGLADSVDTFLAEQRLGGVDVVGSSLGARIVLELARRGRVGATVALDPGGFWSGWERTYFRATLLASIKLVRGLRAALPALTSFPVTRAMLLAQLSARPWSLNGAHVATELKSLAATATFEELVRDLASAAKQDGPAAERSRPVVIGWGRQDRLCLPRQAVRALRAFPNASVHWFEECGHFPMWDQPEETVQLILNTTARPQG